MPRAKKHCGINNCLELVQPGTHCPQHQHNWGRGSPRSKTRIHMDRRLRVLNRDHHICQLRYPGCIGTATICDHIIALALGGQDSDANCQAACQPCSDKKSSDEGHTARGHTPRPRL